jgi:hypothetical protein
VAYLALQICPHRPPGAAPASLTAPSAALPATAATLPMRAHPGLPHAAWAPGDSRQLIPVLEPQQSWNVHPTTVSDCITSPVVEPAARHLLAMCTIT